MENSASKENYFSEEGIEESTQSLMQKLEAAKDPEAYRKQFHDRDASSAASTQQTHASANDKGFSTTSLFVTVLAIVIGTLVGVFLSTYVI